MKERPIIFSAPMVRALLDGRKTQTRRIVKPQPQRHYWQHIAGYQFHVSVLTGADRCYARFAHSIPQNREWDWDEDARCPYGQPGDLLWVREAFIHEPADYCWEASVSIPARPASTAYRADQGGDTRGAGWSSPIHMPRSLSRITLRITDVRVQRLQDISEADAWAEGIERSKECPTRASTIFSDYASPRVAYMHLWESIHGPGSWDANPWVWAITFETIIGQ